jgi:hypothetical protein
VDAWLLFDSAVRRAAISKRPVYRSVRDHLVAWI